MNHRVGCVPGLVVWVGMMLGLFGCVPRNQDPYILACHTFLEQILKSPSSLQIVSEEKAESEKSTTVTIRYDASNSFGAMLRSQIECEYATPAAAEDEPDKRRDIHTQAGTAKWFAEKSYPRRESDRRRLL